MQRGGGVAAIIVAVAVSSVLVTGVGHAAGGPELGVVYGSNGSDLAIQNLYIAQPATEYALTGTLASSRFWLGGFDGLTAVGPNGDTQVTIPWLYDNVTGRGSTVWLVTELGLIAVDAT